MDNCIYNQIYFIRYFPRITFLARTSEPTEASHINSVKLLLHLFTNTMRTTAGVSSSVIPEGSLKDLEQLQGFIGQPYEF